MNVNGLMRRAKSAIKRYALRFTSLISMQIYLTYSVQSICTDSISKPQWITGDYNYSSEVASPPLPFPSYPRRGREWINRANIIVPVDPPPTAKIVGYGTKYLSFFTSLSYFNISIHHKIHYTEKNVKFSEIILNFLSGLL